MRKIFSLMMIAALIIGSTSCKKDPVDDGNDNKDPVVKTLTKSQLYGKKWYNKGAIILHLFNKNGVYGSTDGTWKWLNNSDSMEILEYQGGVTRIWYFNWSEAHEMECKNGKNGPVRLFKDEKW